MLRELDDTEQKRMTLQEAGHLYEGHFIFFTNFEDVSADCGEVYAVPRVISLSKIDFIRSGLYEKYKNQNLFGIPFFCSFFVSTENAPPILSF